MKPLHPLNRRQFVGLGALATGASLLPGLASTAGASPTAAYTLPPLPYAFDALEPCIDAKTMEIHHGKHHAGYVTGLNKALADAPGLATKPLDTLLADLSTIEPAPLRTALRNSGGGNWNHTFFWSTLTPSSKSGDPSEELAVAIQATFGSMDDFKKSFGEAAAKRFGSGWAWLVLADGKLKITSTPNQDNPLMKGLVPDADLGIPLLGLDVWEHAYYLHYQNRRADYIGAWWNILNWKEVSTRFTRATSD